ncbi:secretion protein HlyD family protein [Maricaulis maris MCS10]|uniref:Secretion protein HlyD family protein n=1 Tax=Maricaulis maris (strain MCS10) TaxID=394221 RepID=Q0ARH4_MARMM|nr:efflux RND transporter periplasmic adaptor subunit [Maricaulis maris]ABI65113.1 secretion protein HlyD family protein [Maricaulis maris MCS10]
MSDRRSQLESLSIDRDGGDSSGGGVSIVTTLVIALLFAAVSAGATWYLTRSTAPAPQPVAAVETPAPAAETPAEAAATPARATPRSSGLVATGYIVARRQATVSAEITGRISELLVEEGARVEEGQILARLDDTRARIQLDLLIAQRNAAAARPHSLIAQLAEAQRVLERARTLAEREIGSEAAVTAARTQFESLTAQIEAARADYQAVAAQVRAQEDLIDRHIVRSPFTGIVIAKNAQVGEILFPGSAGGGFTRTGVATLVDMESLEIEVDVNEGQIGRVTPGQRVEARLDAYPDWRIRAHVEAIIPTADRARATITVRVAFDERDGRILPDMASRVIFVE